MNPQISLGPFPFVHYQPAQGTLPLAQIPTTSFPIIYHLFWGDNHSPIGKANSKHPISRWAYASITGAHVAFTINDYFPFIYSERLFCTPMIRHQKLIPRLIPIAARSKSAEIELKLECDT